MRASTALLVLCVTLPVGGSEGASASDELQRALASAFVKEAVERCGYEASPAGSQFLEKAPAAKAGAETQRRFVDNLWQQTWACNPDFIGRSCMASRLGLCERVFLEYGPEGAVIPGLLKPIIHK